MTDSIRLEKRKEVVSFGRYYINFKYSRGSTFSIHNSLHMFPLNKFGSYYFETNYILTSNRLLIFSMNLEKNVYFASFSSSNEYLFSIENKTIEILNFFDGLMPKGRYIIISNYENIEDDFVFSFTINRYLIDIKPKIEYSVSKGFNFLELPSKIGVIDLSKYKKNRAYLTYNGDYYKSFSC